MYKLHEIACVLMLLCLTNSLANGQYCAFDMNVYYNEGTYTINDFTQWWSWNCQDSYIVLLQPTKTLTIDFYGSVNCRTNKLILSDSNGMKWNYCQSQSNTYENKNVRWIRIRKSKICTWCTAPLRLQFNLKYRDDQPTTTPTPAQTTTAYANTEKCGRPAINPNLSQLKIVGGVEAQPNSWPWQVYITDGLSQCGGSLINRQWVLTAAHCKMENTKVILGLHSVYPSDSDSVEIDGTFFNHPDYTENGSHDIALIKLKTPVDYTNKISPICMPGTRTVEVGEKLLVTGWGLTVEEGDVSNILLQTDVNVQQQSHCTEQFGINPLTDNELCAGIVGSAPHDACQGDSGGPLIKRDSTGAFWQVGVVSSGVGCAGHGIYTKVSAYEEWINQVMSQN